MLERIAALKERQRKERERVKWGLFTYYRRQYGTTDSTPRVRANATAKSETTNRRALAYFGEKAEKLAELTSKKSAFTPAPRKLALLLAETVTESLYQLRHHR